MPGKNGKLPALPVRKAVIELNGELTGWQATVRINPPLAVARLTAAESVDDVVTGFKAIILDWNFVDESGEPLPSPQDGGLERLPAEILQEVMVAYQKKLGEASETPKD